MVAGGGTDIRAGLGAAETAGWGCSCCCICWDVVVTAAAVVSPAAG